MTPLDDLFSTDESRAEVQLEKVVTLIPADITDFPNHPFKVKQDEAMAVWRAISAAFCAAFAAAAAAFCVAFAVASMVLMAALEVFSAVFTALSVDFTVPFAPAFAFCFPAERADCLMVRSVRSADLMVWFRLLRMLIRVSSVFCRAACRAVSSRGVLLGASLHSCSSMSARCPFGVPAVSRL